MDVLIRSSALLLLAVHRVILFFKWFFRGDGPKVRVSQCEDPTLKLSATVLAAKIRNKEITSEELVKAYIKRIKDVNPVVNAIVEDRFADALADARKVDDFLKNGTNLDDLSEKRPLFGIPVTIKECLAVKGMSYTGCSKTREGIKAEDDCDVVKLLKQAGAIPLLVSTTPEFCTAVDTSNKITGTTRNPYDTRHTSGGSSGGEGALLGAGASLIGFGSDIGGSIRIPATFNGVFGHKPTGCAVSLKGHFPLVDCKVFTDSLVIGPMSRYAEDLLLSLKVLTRNAPALRLDEEVDLAKTRVYFMEDCGNEFALEKVDKDVKIAIKEAVMHLSRNFHCGVQHKNFKDLGSSVEITSSTLFRMEKFPDPLNDSKIKYNFVVEFFKNILGTATLTMNGLMFLTYYNLNKILSRNYPKYVEKYENLKKTLIDELGTNGVLIYPSYPTSAFRSGESILSLTSSGVYLAVFNILGFPATSVPAGLNKNGMPIGIQIVAAPNQDRLCLAVAKELENCFGGWQQP